MVSRKCVEDKLISFLASRHLEHSDRLNFISAQSNMNYKECLSYMEIEEGFDKATLDKAFRKLSLKYHPDKNLSDPSATAKFQKLGEAYHKLEKRLSGGFRADVGVTDEEDGWEDEDEEDENGRMGPFPQDFNFFFRSRGGAEFPNFGGGSRRNQRSQSRRYGGFGDADDFDIFEV